MRWHSSGVSPAAQVAGVVQGPAVSCEYAVQVMVVVPAAKGASEALRVQLPFASQSYMGLPSLRVANRDTLSPVVVGVPTATAASQSPLAFAAGGSAGQLIETLPVASSTVMLKLHMPPPVSEVAVTAVVPTGKNEPDAGVEVTDPQSPDDVGSLKVTCAPRWPPSVVLAKVVMLAGHSSVQVGPGAPAITVTFDVAVLSCV